MQKDNSPAIYLARPCQYAKTEACRQYYWTEGRHAEPLVEAMNSTISALKERYSAKFVEFIGHSGGGTMAVLIAAKRSDVKRMITIAANLDVEFFTQYHKVTPMKGSLNPINFIHKVKHIPQLHLAGGKDKSAPPKLIKRYINNTLSNCIYYEKYKNNGHHEGWLTIWPQVLREKLTCKK